MVKVAEKCYFAWGMGNLFSSWDVFYLIIRWGLSVVCQQIFFISYRYQNKGAEAAKCNLVSFCGVWENFIFHRILMGFFIGFLLVSAFRNMQHIFAISYRYWNTKHIVQSSNFQICHYLPDLNVLFFHLLRLIESF